MENLKRTGVYLSILGLLCVAMPSCKGKSDEEKLAELQEQMNDAKSLEEIAAISKRIKELGEKVESNTITTKVALGKPLTYWEKKTDGAKITQLQIIFRDPKVSSSHPVTVLANDSASGGNKYFSLEVYLKNLGPREIYTAGHAEVKVNNGYLYDLRYTVKKDFGDLYIAAGKSQIALFYSEIPEDTYPVEVFGELGNDYYIDGHPIGMKFSLKLTQFK